MIKTHISTGLKYLCYTRVGGDYYKGYKGSGKYWRKYLKKYGDDIVTELIFETTDKEEFIKYARNKSIELNIVESKEWANLKLEEGDGGDTVSSKMWVTNGVSEKYVDKKSIIEEGWIRGRHNCKFSDPKFQKEMSSRVSLETRGLAIKNAWNTGKCDHRDSSNLGSRNKEAAVKEKIRKALTGKRRSKEQIDNLKEGFSNIRYDVCPHCKKNARMNELTRYHFDKCKMYDRNS